jgi:hypothetical protein
MLYSSTKANLKLQLGGGCFVQEIFGTVPVRSYHPRRIQRGDTERDHVATLERFNFGQLQQVGCSPAR